MSEVQFSLMLRLKKIKALKIKQESLITINFLICDLKELWCRQERTLETLKICAPTSAAVAQELFSFLPFWNVPHLPTLPL